MTSMIPDDGKKVEFWTIGMKIVYNKSGIVGVFRDGSFWSEDRCDHWSCGEIIAWAYLP